MLIPQVKPRHRIRSHKQSKLAQETPFKLISMVDITRVILIHADIMYYGFMPAKRQKNVLAIPMYNCRDQISLVLNDLATEKPLIDEIWIFDNQSSDGSVEVAKNFLFTNNFPYNVKIYENHSNIVFGGSHKAIFKKLMESNFKAVVVLHGDFQARARDVEKLIEKGEIGNTTILGSRFMRNSSREGYSKFRLLWNRVFNILISIKYRTRVYDLGSGLNLFQAEIIALTDFQTLPGDLTFNVELLKRLLANKLSIHWVPITWVSDSENSNVRVISQTLKTFKLVLGNYYSEPSIALEPELKINYKCSS